MRGARRVVTASGQRGLGSGGAVFPLGIERLSESVLPGVCCDGGFGTDRATVANPARFFTAHVVRKHRATT